MEEKQNKMKKFSVVDVATSTEAKVYEETTKQTLDVLDVLVEIANDVKELKKRL